MSQPRRLTGNRAPDVYEWVVFVHVAAVLGFMLAHGVQVTATWKMRSEPDPQQSLTFFNLLPSVTQLRVLLAVIVLTGAAAAFMGSWWGQGWLWASVLLLAGISAAMWQYAGSYYGLIETAATRLIEVAGDPAQEPIAQREFQVARRSWQPIGMTVIGVGGTLVILWLMMFKPF